MSLILMCAAAFADGSVLWLNTNPDPTLAPTAAHLTAEDLYVPAGWTEEDDRAIAHLRAELEAVRPLLDVFDGELQIMRRLEDALVNITAIREVDRALVYEALLFQGLAVQRYFQDALADEPGAQPYRVEGLSGQVEVRPWVDALALDPDRVPGAAEIPEAPERLQFQELRARHQLRATAQISASLSGRERLQVDGVEAAVDRARVLAGNHWVALSAQGELLVRERLRLAPGESAFIKRKAGPDDLAALTDALEAGDRLVPLSAAVVNTLSELAGPTQIVVVAGRKTLRYTVTKDTAILQEPTRDDSDGGLVLRAAAGSGWMYDGDFLLQNTSDGATAEIATVNAVAPLLSAGAELQRGWLAAGAGVDALLPLGAHHDLPVGDSRLRLRAYPHLAVGTPMLQLTAGALLPWHLGLGPRAHITLSQALGLELTGAWVYGLGLPRSREDGTTFAPDTAQTAWLSLGFRLQ